MDKPKNIVLVPGWKAKTSSLKPLATELEKLNWKVFLIKLPGFELPLPRKVWETEDYADFVFKKSCQFFKKEGFYLFGHSFGGRLAIKLGANNPMKIKGLILCSAAGLSRPNILKRTFFLLLAKMGNLLPFFSVKKSLRKIIYRLAHEHDYQKTKGIMRKIFKKVIEENLKPLIPKIKVPVLILWGKEDKTTPVFDAFYLRKKLPLSKLIIFEKEGHRLPYIKPKEIAQEIERWAKEQKS